MQLKELSAIIHSPMPDSWHAHEIRFLCMDSRQISFPEFTVFIALKSAKQNGHDFIEDAYQKGIRVFIVQENIPKDQYAAGCFLVVENTRRALQQIAVSHRKKFNIPIIGITGSNGKTIVKEWLHQLLSTHLNVCRSPRSYNSQIGVPLSIWQLQSNHQLGIFEAGISQPDEMELLQKMIEPSLGIFTNLGAAHDDGFANRKEKAIEKWKLFTNCQTVICRSDYPELVSLIENHTGTILDWSTQHQASITVTVEKKNQKESKITLNFKDSLQEFWLPFTDAASVENGIHCIIACLHLKIKPETLQAGLLNLHALPMRLEWKKGYLHSLLLNDSYSYDLTSLEIALHQLSQQASHSKRIAILSDLPGYDDENAYNWIANLLGNYQVNQLYAIGENIQAYQSLFQARHISFSGYKNTQDFINRVDKSDFEKSTVLIKGARHFGFEKIANYLQEQQHQTFLEINLSALANNLTTYRGLVNKGVKIMVMLKAFGYGSTDAELGRWLQHRGANYLAVAYTDEGVALREGGVTLPIMVMNPEPETFRQIVQYQLEPELYSFAILQAFDEYLTENGMTYYPVHIKIDTGMHRLGFEPQDVHALMLLLQSSLSFKVQSVFTHLVASENAAHDAFTQHQNQVFKQVTEALSQSIINPFLKHTANTAAIARHPQLHYDMVRLGIGLFGVSNTQNQKLNLFPVTKLYTTVAQVKEVKAGESVGYGRHAVLTRDSRIATVRIGYADGYSRQLGNGNGYMYIAGKKTSVVGNVCMDMTMLDVTELPEVKPGDRVEVFGEQISVNDLARLCNTIPYEIMTGINRRVKRVMVEE